VITEGYALPAKKIIHTVGPVWYGGNSGERNQLASSYKSSLSLAAENNLRSIAFPLISSGVYGYPRNTAAEVAVESIGEYLLEDPDMQVFLIIYGSKGEFVDKELLSNIYNIESIFNSNDYIASDELLGMQIAHLMSLKGENKKTLSSKANLTTKELHNILYGGEASHPALLSIGIALELSMDDMGVLLAVFGPWPAADKRLQIAIFFMERGITNIHKINLNNFALNFNILP
jgi:hypothetical protein